MKTLRTAPYKRVPGKWLYWLAAALYLGVPLVLAAFAVPKAIHFYEEMQSHGQHLYAPGRQAFTLEAPGEYAMYLGDTFENASSYSQSEGRMAISPTGPESGVSLRLEDPTGKTVPLRTPKMNSTVTMGTSRWVCIGLFTAHSAGEYVLVGEPGPKRSPEARELFLLVVESGWPFGEILDAVTLLLPLLFCAFISILAGVGLAMFVYVKRYDERAPKACNM